MQNHSAAPAVVFAIGLCLLQAETPDLLPLLPSSSPSNQVIIDALKAGEARRAAESANGLKDPAERRLWQGMLAILGNDPVTAIRTLRSGADDPKALGVAYYLARQYFLFREQMQEAIRREPRDFGPYYFLGRHYDADLGDCQQAAVWFRRALERSPSYARARAHLGYCLERLGQSAEAEQAYRSALPLPMAQLGMARLELAGGRTREALLWAEKAVNGEPGDAVGLRLLARILESAGRIAGSVEALERAARAAPHDASLRYQLHRLYRSSGDGAKAKAALSEYERLRAIYGAQPE